MMDNGVRTHRLYKRPEIRQCETCTCYVGGQCHRHAPVVIDASWTHPEMGRQFETRTTWPDVEKTDLCGDYDMKMVPVTDVS